MKNLKKMLISLLLILVVLISLQAISASELSDTGLSAEIDNDFIAVNADDDLSSSNIQNDLNNAGASDFLIAEEASNADTSNLLKDNTEALLKDETDTLQTDETDAHLKDETDTVYVSPNGSDNNDGSEANPYLSVKNAINSNAGTIIINPGIYNEGNISINHSVNIIGLENVVFDGTNSTHLFWINTNKTTIRFINLNFQNYNGAIESVNGAVISISEELKSAKRLSLTDVIIENCTFKNNYEIKNGMGGQGIISINTAGDVNITDSVFENNSAYYGGAIAVSSNGTVNIRDSIFKDNYASLNGGSIRQTYGTLNIESSIFENNIAGENGEALYVSGGTSNIQRSIFLNNGGNANDYTIYYSAGGNYPNHVNVDSCYFGSNDNQTSNIYGDRLDNWTVLNYTLSEETVFLKDSITINLDFTQITDGINYYPLNGEMPSLNLTLRSSLGTLQDDSLVIKTANSTKYTAGIESGIDNVAISCGSDILSIPIQIENEVAYVGAGGVDDENHGSEDAPYATIAYALLQDVDKIVLLGGGYKEHDLLISKSIIIYGENKAIINGESNGIFIINGDNIRVKFENLALANGNSINGGAILAGDDSRLLESNITIENCDFTSNQAQNEGGAIWANVEKLIIRNSLFNETSADKGGAVFLYNGTLSVEKSIFINNIATSGSAIYANDFSAGESNINYNIFESNSNSVIFSNNDLNTEFNYFGTNDNPSSLVEGVSIGNWTILDISIDDEDVLENEIAYITFDLSNYSNGTDVFKLDNAMPEITVKFKHTISPTSPQKIETENNVAVVEYLALSRGLENIEVYLPLNLYNLTFSVRENENIIYVSKDGSDSDGDGSLTKPYASIQKALEANALKGGGKSIYVYAGTYDVNAQSIDANVSIVPASSGDDEVIFNGGEGFIFEIAENIFANIENIVFINGTNAIKNHGTLSINSSSFINNTGAIYNNGSLSLKNSLFMDNEAENGGAIYLDCEAALENNTMINCTASPIFVNDGVLNRVNITFLNNESVKTLNNSIYIPVTITDDNGNNITGGQVKVTFNYKDIITLDVVEGKAGFDYEARGKYLISGSYLNAEKSNVKTGYLELAEAHWYIGDEGYDLLSEAVEAAADGDVVKGVAGVYDINNTVMVSNKTITITSLTDEAIVLNGPSNGILLSSNRYSNLTLINLVFNDTQHIGDAGALENYGNLTIRNCTFSNNMLKHYDTTTDYKSGGAIYNLFGTVYITDTLFINNTAQVGGAIYTSSDAVMEIRNCTFINNTGTAPDDSGGAIANRATLNIYNSTFSSNSANGTYKYQSGCGGAIANFNILNIYNSTFDNNSAMFWGGSIRNTGILHVESSNFTRSFTITNGGAIHTSSSSTGTGYAVIKDCLFENNTVNGTSSINGRGGAIDGESFIQITDSIFNNNNGPYGGAVFIGYHDSEEIYNCVFNSNNATFGGAIYNYHNSATLSHCTFIGNTAEEGGAVLINNTLEKSVSIVSDLFLSNKADAGAAISTNSYLEVSYSNLLNNTAENDSAIYNHEDEIYVKADYNYWGSNENPINLSVNVTPKYWTILKVDLNQSENLVVGLPVSLNISFTYCTNDTDIIPLSGVMPGIDLELYPSLGELSIDSFTLNDQKSLTYNPTAYGNESIRIHVFGIIAGSIDFIIDPFLIKDLMITSIENSSNSNFTFTYNITDLENNPVETGNLTISIINSENQVVDTITSNLTNGVAVINYIFKYSGNYSINAIYDGAIIYQNQTNLSAIYVDKFNSYLDAAIVSIKMGMDLEFIVDLLVENPSGKVYVTIANRIYTASVNNAKASFTILDLAVGNYTALINYTGDKQYHSSSIERNFTVEPNTYAIKAGNIKVAYNTGRYLTATLYKDGALFASQNLKFTINKVTYTVKTNSKGQAKLLIKVKPGTYKTLVKYGSVSKTVTVKVTKDKAKFYKASKTVKRNKYIKVRLLNSKKKAIKGQKVKIKVGKKTYTVKTNKKGYAKLKITKKRAKIGKVKVTYKLASSKLYKCKSIKVTLKVKK